MALLWPSIRPHWFISKMAVYISLFFLLLIYSPVFGALIKWIPNRSFNLPANFKDGKLPCSSQTIVFPETLLSSVELSLEIYTRGYVLPVNGEIIMPEDGKIIFDEIIQNATCKGDAYYIDMLESSWIQPDVWSSDTFNKATPDNLRIPCFNDVVEFPEDSQFSIQLPDITQEIQNIRIRGQDLDDVQFRELVFTEDNHVQRFILNQFQETGLKLRQKRCLSRAGCACQNTLPVIDCTVKYCEIPKCNNPIKPPGHCCKICGGTLEFDIDETMFDLVLFKNMVEKTIDDYGGTSKLLYYIGRLILKVQLVVVDKQEYTGISSQVVNEIDQLLEKHWSQGFKQILISGSPLSESGVGLKITITMFFVVILAIVAVYVWYYQIDKMRSPLSQSEIGFLSRFHIRTESIVSLTRQDSVSSVPSGTAFRNPLYDSQRSSAKIAKSNTDEDDQFNITRMSSLLRDEQY